MPGGPLATLELIRLGVVRVFQAAAFVYDQNTWDLHPTNINVDPSRLLDWSDPQWLFVLRSVPEGGVRVIVAAGAVRRVLNVR